MPAEGPKCPVCGHSLMVRLAEGRKSGKPFVMLICPLDGRHFRGFITYRPYVTQVLDEVATRQSLAGGQT